MALIGPQPYAEFYLRIGDKDFYGINWEGWLKNRWTGGILVTTSNVIRPSAPNGFEYACTHGGQTGFQEPSWPAFVGSTVTDGGAVWTCQVTSIASLSTTVASVAWNAPTGITLSVPSLTGQVAQTLIDATSATVGTDYPVNCVATMADGEIKIGQLKMKVR
jgi:hypothetical protein